MLGEEVLAVEGYEVRKISDWRLTKRQAQVIMLGGALVVMWQFLSWASSVNILQTLRLTVRANFPQIPFEVFIAIIVVAIGTLLILIGGYFLNWTWTGLGPITRPKIDNVESLPAKTLWDWMQLLIIPSVIAGGALFFNSWNTDTQNNIALDNQREATLQAYYDKMSELLLDKGLQASSANAEIRSIARARTLAVLRTLDGERKRSVLEFIFDSQLISGTTPVVVLSGADLSNVSLGGAQFPGVNLSDVTLRNTYFWWADLSGANLSGASLSNADMSYSDLRGANLSGISAVRIHLVDANLDNADISVSNLIEADLGKALMRDVNLQGSDLTDANLAGADLTNAHLDHASTDPIFGRSAKLANADLYAANLSNANLTDADLSVADLGKADLTNADLTGAILYGANLKGAKVTQGQLAKAQSLEGTIMPDGTRHE